MCVVPSYQLLGTWTKCQPIGSPLTFSQPALPHCVSALGTILKPAAQTWLLTEVFWLCRWLSEDVQAEMSLHVLVPITVKVSPAGSVGWGAGGQIHISAPLLL